MWPDTQVRRLLRVAVPIVQAPMAGETDRPALTAAVSAAGGLGSIGAAYDQPDAIRAKIRAVRAITDRPFAVNLFTPVAGDATPEKVARARSLLAPWRERYHLADDLPALTMPQFDDQLAVIMEERVPVASFTFGRPAAAQIAALKSAGCVIVGTATTVPEAEMLAADGVDAIVAQGAEAAAHRGSFLAPVEDSLVGLMALVPAMTDRVTVPVIAAGGIMDGRGIAAAIMLGAQGVQLGTAFLTSPESGASAAWKTIVMAQTADQTCVTRVYSGRPARGIRNLYRQELEPHESELPGFPAMNALTRAIRGAAGKAGDTEPLSLWAGQGAPLAREIPAGALVGVLAEETIDRLKQGSGA
jgi:nitronate monooxygenase